jgi:hypothetical protein
MAKAFSTIGQDYRRKVGEGVKRAWKERKQGAEGWRGIEPTFTFDIKNLREAILAAAHDTCECCALGGVYNGFASGPLLFICPKKCGCHC